MKTLSRLLLVGATAAAAGVLAAGPAAAAPAAVPAAAADFCAASTAGTAVSGSCTLDTFLGAFGATFTGTVGAGGNGSGTITLRAGFLGTRTGTWTGGPFTPGSTATVNYSVPTPVGPVNGSFQVPVS